MAALAWLLIPLVGVLVAAVWARWTVRGRSSDDGASLARYERFRTAMQPGETPSLRLREGESGEAGASDAEPV